MNNGIITPDARRGKTLGFTSDRFSVGSYLWKEDKRIMISFIESKRRGNFRDLVRRIHALGLAVAVPTPLGRMQAIVVRHGYIPTVERDPKWGDVNVWTLAP